MSSQDQYIHAKFGIDEVYFHEGFTPVLLEKLRQRALITLDADDHIAIKYTTHDTVLVFNKKPPTQGHIYRFLKFLDQDKNKENYIESNTLINEEELFAAIKSKTFVLVTTKTLLK